MIDMALTCGDCFEGMAALDAKSVDVVLSDPPFEEEAHTKQKRLLSPREKGLRAHPLSFPAITEDERAATCVAFARLVRKWALVFCQVEAVHKWIACGKAAGLRYARTCIWVKPDPMPNLRGQSPGQGYESIVTFWCGKPRDMAWNGGGRAGTYIFVSKNAEREWIHPTEKPLRLMNALVSDFTSPGDLILDPFAGSATTLIAAHRLGRQSLGFEKDQTFFEKASERIAAERLSLRLDAHRGGQISLFPDPEPR